MRRELIVVGWFICAACLQAGPTAPVNPAERNDAFDPESKVTKPAIKAPAEKKNQPSAKGIEATVDKPLASVAGKEAAINRTPQEKKMVSTPTYKQPTTQTAQSQVTVITGSTTLLRPQDHPVRSKMGSKFQSALNEAREASATRAEKYKKDAKLQKVNEFVPTAPVPAETVKAGSEPKSQTP